MEIRNTLVFINFNLIPLFKHVYTKTSDLDRETTFSSDKSSMQLSAYMKKINENTKQNEFIANAVEVSSVSGSNNKQPVIGLDEPKIICDSMLGQIIVLNTSGTEECQYVSNHAIQMNQLTPQVCSGIECSYFVRTPSTPIVLNQPPVPVQYTFQPPPAPIPSPNRIIKQESNLYLKPEQPKVMIHTVTVKQKPEVKIFKELVPSPPQTITESVELPRQTIRIIEPPRIETIRETVSSPPIISTLVKSIRMPRETLKIFEPAVTETLKTTVFSEIELPRATVSVTLPPKTETLNKTIISPPVTSTVFSQIELPPETVRVKIPAKTKYISQFIPTEPVTSFITKQIIEPSETVTVENIKTVRVLESNVNKENIRREDNIQKTVSLQTGFVSNQRNTNTSNVALIQQPAITQPIISVVPSIIAAGGIVSGYNTFSSNMFSQKPTKIIRTNRVQTNISCDSICRNQAVKTVTIRTKNSSISSCSSSNNKEMKRVKLFNNQLLTNKNRKTIRIITPPKRIDSSAVLKTVQVESNDDSETFRYNPDCYSSCVYHNGILSNSYKFNRRGDYSNGRISLTKKYKTINELKNNLDLIYDKFIKKINSTKQESKRLENRDKEFVNYLFESIYEKNQNLLKERNENAEKFNLEIQNLLKNKQFEAKLNKNKIVNNYLKKLINSSPVINKGVNRVKINQNFDESSFITERSQLINKLRNTERIQNLKEILKKKLLLKKKLQKSEIFRRIKERNLLSRLVGSKIQKIKTVLKNMTILDQKSLMDILLNSCENFCDFDLEIICKNYASQETFCKSMNSSDDVVIFLSELIHN